MVCKVFFCSEFPVIPEKLWRKEEADAVTKRFAFQAIAKTKQEVGEDLAVCVLNLQIV